jgi:hypothetical protein
MALRRCRRFRPMFLSAPARAGSPDISAQRLLSNWQEGDPGMKMLAEDRALRDLRSAASSSR